MFLSGRGARTFHVFQHAVADDRVADDMAPLFGRQPGAALQVLRVDANLADVVQQAGQRQQPVAVDVARGATSGYSVSSALAIGPKRSGTTPPTTCTQS